MSSSNLQKRLIQTWAFLFKNWIITKRNVFSLFEILFWPVVGFFSVGLLTRFLELDANMSGFILIGIISMRDAVAASLGVREGEVEGLEGFSLSSGFEG